MLYLTSVIPFNLNTKILLAAQAQETLSASFINLMQDTRVSSHWPCHTAVLQVVIGHFSEGTETEGRTWQRRFCSRQLPMRQVLQKLEK